MGIRHSPTKSVSTVSSWCLLPLSRSPPQLPRKLGWAWRQSCCMRRKQWEVSTSRWLLVNQGFTQVTFSRPCCVWEEQWSKSKGAAPGHPAWLWFHALSQWALYKGNQLFCRGADTSPGTKKPIRMPLCSTRGRAALGVANPRSRAVDRVKSGISHALVSLSEMCSEPTYLVIQEELREMEANTRYAKQWWPDLLVQSRMKTYIGNTFAHGTNEEFPSPSQI